jgi:hypothetical protein
MLTSALREISNICGMRPALLLGVQRRSSDIFLQKIKGKERVLHCFGNSFSSKSASSDAPAHEDQIMLAGMIFHAYHGVLPEVRVYWIL